MIPEHLSSIREPQAEWVTELKSTKHFEILMLWYVKFSGCLGIGRNTSIDQETWGKSVTYLESSVTLQTV